MASYGLSFLPGEGNDNGGTGTPPDRIQQAIRLLNLRLPSVPGANAVAPQALLASPGGQPGMNAALPLQALQRLLLAMAGLGGVEAGDAPMARGGMAPQAFGGMAGGGMAPRVGIGQTVPPGPMGGPISPPGPGNLPPMGPAPGWQNPRMVNSHPGGEFGPTGPIIPRVANSHPGGEFGPKGPIVTPKPRVVNSHPGGEFGPRGPIIPRIRTSHPRGEFGPKGPVIKRTVSI